jgi:hypothetical protein
MIKFFRRIRYNLMETGKTGKYFKYAIGEIVLVVVGILIALSINNWNEQRKASIIEQDLYKRTISDLDHEQISVDEIFIEFKITIEAYNHIYDETKGKANRDTINNIYNKLRWPFIMDLVVSDKLKTKTEITRIHILELINQKSKIEDRLKFIISAYNDYKSDIMNPYLNKNGVYNSDKSYSYKEIDFYEFLNLDLVSYDKLKALYSTIEFDQILFELKSKSLYIIVQLERLIEKNHEFKTALEIAIN